MGTNADEEWLIDNMNRINEEGGRARCNDAVTAAAVVAGLITRDHAGRPALTERGRHWLDRRN